MICIAQSTGYPVLYPNILADEIKPFWTTTASFVRSRVLTSSEFDSPSANEPATSAVTAERKLVSYWNQGERMAPFSALRNPWWPLVCPYRAQDLCPVDLCLTRICPPN